jgi:hypothetical protein
MVVGTVNSKAITAASEWGWNTVLIGIFNIADEKSA